MKRVIVQNEKEIYRVGCDDCGSDFLRIMSADKTGATVICEICHPEINTDEWRKAKEFEFEIVVETTVLRDQEGRPATVCHEDYIPPKDGDDADLFEVVAFCADCGCDILEGGGSYWSEHGDFCSRCGWKRAPKRMHCAWSSCGEPYNVDEHKGPYCPKCTERLSAKGNE